MSEFELTQLMYLANTSGNEALTIYISIVAGYLVAAYTIGASLRRYEIALVNSLFIFATSAFTYSTWESFFDERVFTNDIEAMDKAVATNVSNLAENLFLLIVTLGMVAGIVGSLLFMWGIRRRDRII